MNIHEYQAKELLAKFGVAVPKGIAAMIIADLDKVPGLKVLEREKVQVLLDEMNIALRYDYIPLDEVLDFLRTEKPADTHVVITGRNAADALLAMADLATEMTLIKHPFRSGVKAQAGIEF